MPKTDVVTTRVKPETKAKLRAIAESTKRSEAYLANEAIEAFVEVNDWQVREIKLALDDARGGEPEVPHERMVEWLKSWGTDDELPPPKPEKSV
jgi:RHH-type rel operon transcriptional repressor/antitoxin RelB